MALRQEIIAEIGINHGGNIPLAMLMVEEAKRCGADTVKFQLYDPQKLLNEEDFTDEDWRAIKESRLLFSQVALLKRHCDKLEIEFLASAFDLERLGWLEYLKVKRHKLASRSVYNKEYCQAVIDTGKPYLVSTGWINIYNPLKESPTDTYRRLGVYANKHCSPFYCVSHYPTDLKDIHLYEKMFRSKGGFYTGFSDHTVGTTSAITALSWGAEVVEKHFTINKTLPGPDQQGSATPEELRFLCQYRDELQQLKKN